MRVARKPIRSFEFRVIARRRDVEPRCYKLEPASTKRAHIRRVCTPLYFSTILTLSLPLSLISSLLLFFRCYFIDDSCGKHAKPSILHRHVCTAQEQNASYTRARSSILLRPETTCAQKQTRTKRRESRELRSPRKHDSRNKAISSRRRWTRFIKTRENRLLRLRETHDCSSTGNWMVDIVQAARWKRAKSRLWTSFTVSSLASSKAAWLDAKLPRRVSRRTGANKSR